MTLILQAIQEAITERPINGKQFHLDNTLNETSFTGACNGWWIKIW